MSQRTIFAGLWFVVVLFVVCPSARAQYVGALVPPYLQAVTNTSVYVLAESYSTDSLMVEYGLTKSYGFQSWTTSCDTTSDSTFIHNIKISSLSPNTRYHYRVVYNGSKSGDASFQTAPNPGTPFRFAWMADFRTGVTVHDTIARRVREAHPVMSLYGGDLAINAKYGSLKEQFFRPEELALIAEVPFFNTPGNHERWTQNTRAFTQAPESPSEVQEYYSFDYGDMHVLVLNNEIPYYEGSLQYRFAEHDLSSATKAWKVVINHRPGYCAGGHGEDSLMMKMSENVFVPNHVNVVFNGHSHFFQHNLVDGVHHMVIGSVGAPLYNLGTAPYVVKAAKEYNYGIIDVTPSSFDLMVYNDKGMPLDTLSLKK
ncbi:MAG: metallophosphoesterase [Ignavibacteriales bacterium]|nr:metallophosphoesterase [Ignavibacteriales bacterium]